MLKACEDWAERLSAYLDDETTPNERAQVNKHLARCEHCRALLELMRCDVQDTKAALETRVASEGFADAVMATIIELPATDRYAEIPLAMPKRKHFLRWLAWGTSIAAPLVLIAVILATPRMLGGRGGMRVILSASKTFPQAKSPQKELHAAYMSRETGHDAAEANSLVDSSGEPDQPTNMAFTPSHDLRINRDTERTSTPPQPSIAPPQFNYGLADKLQIAYTASVTVESPEVERALEKVEILYRQELGFVLNSSYQRSATKDPTTATVNGRVPADKLGQLLLEMDKLGLLQSRTINGEDLTAEHLQNLLNMDNQEEALARLGGISDKAKSRDALSAEDRRKETSHDLVSAKVDDYQLLSKVKLADVSITITSAPVKPPALRTSNPFLTMLIGALHGLKGFGIWLLSVLIPIVIFIPVWLPLLWLAVWLWKRYGWRPATGAGSPPSTD